MFAAMGKPPLGIYTHGRCTGVFIPVQKLLGVHTTVTGAFVPGVRAWSVHTCVDSMRCLHCMAGGLSS